MTYEELTEQSTVTITRFMDLAKSADNKFSAEILNSATWGATLLWRDLTNKMKQDLDCKYGPPLTSKMQYLKSSLIGSPYRY